MTVAVCVGRIAWTLFDGDLRGEKEMKGSIYGLGRKGRNLERYMNVVKTASGRLAVRTRTEKR